MIGAHFDPITDPLGISGPRTPMNGPPMPVKRRASEEVVGSPVAKKFVLAYVLILFYLCIQSITVIFGQFRHYQTVRIYSEIIS